MSASHGMPSILPWVYLGICKLFIFSAVIIVECEPCGSIHQGHKSFGDMSREWQCAFMILLALLCNQGDPKSRNDGTAENHPKF